MRNRNSFDYTRTADNRDYSDLTRCVPHTEENIRPVHYGESDVSAMQFSGDVRYSQQNGVDAQRPAQEPTAPEQQSFIPNNYGTNEPSAFGLNVGSGSGNVGNGFGTNNSIGGSVGYGNGGQAGYDPSARAYSNQPLQTAERPLVFKNKRVEGQFIYEYRDRLEIYKYTGVGMIYVETLFKNGY